MSTIEKLSIRGIRSFGIKAEDEQIILFNSPLTLILGANGCGKTTIIECLKYALTGEMPPGSDKGKSFIHDPKIFDFAECLGQVKLLVKNIRNEKVTVARSMKISHKRGKPTFETIDATINFESNGQKDTISKRCVDVNSEMCHFMGVSKAIINNVLFCHQEDASWPLDEGKKLKEKFDAIFGTSEYNKAIEKLIKLRKQQVEMVRIKESELKFLGHLKKEMENKSLEFQKAENKLEELTNTRTKFEGDIKPLQERLMKISKIELEIGKLQSQKIELITKIKNCKDQEENLKQKIKKIFNGTTMLLDREIRTFKETMNEKKNHLHSLEEQLKIIKIREKGLSTDATEYERKRNHLIFQRQQEQEFIAERAQKIQELCNGLNIKIDGNLEESTIEIDRALKKIEDAFKNEENKKLNLGIAHEKSEQQMQKEIDNLRESKASLESDITLKLSQKRELQQQQSKYDADIKSVESSAQSLALLNKEIEKVEIVFENYCKSVNLEEIKNNINEKKLNVAQLQEQLDSLDNKLTFLNSISKLLAEITLKQNDYEKRENEIKRIKNKHSDNLKKIFQNKTIDNNYKRNLQIAYDSFQQQLTDFHKTISQSKLKEKELQIIRKTQKYELNKFEKDLTDCEEKIYEKCHSTIFEELLAKTKENVEKYRLDYGALKSAEAMYKRYIKKIEDEPCCPLCHKDLERNEATDLSTELTDEIQRLPDNIRRTENLLETEQKKYESLLELKTIIEKANKLKSDIPVCKQNLKKTEENLSKISNDIESYQMLTTEPATSLELANSMLGDMSLLDEAIKDLSRIRKELENVKSKLPSSNTTESIDSVQLQKSTAVIELRNERSELDKLQSKYENETDALNKLREKRNILKDKQIKLQEGIQALTQLKERRNEINIKFTVYTEEIANQQKKLIIIKNSLNISLEKISKLKEENKKNFDKLTQKLNLLRKVDHDIQRLSRELSGLAELNLVEALGDLKRLIKRCMDEQNKLAKEQSNILESIEGVNEELMQQETKERDLKDNRELKVLQEKHHELQEQFDELMKDMGDLNYNKIIVEKEKLVKQRDDITIKKGEILGQMGEINNQINTLKKELNTPKYKDSIKNYRKEYYEVEVAKRIISDLGHYRMALEKALLKFHSEKMEKINRLIREFWRQIYRGNDIDYIQIQTDELKADIVDKKRSYNYRVIQSKNGIEIDMRGRCSAGQRVLASLIIRMALAETFSSNCGVLALDEPTTNLDHNNILSLCEALNEIVNERQLQSNFMLIIITHDEEFISTLGRIKSYHKVYRNDDGKSVVRKVRVA